MKITRENYEIFFIDHLDGNLSPSQEDELRLFVEMNPDLAKELDGLREVMLEPLTVEYGQKELLKKTEQTQCGIDNRLHYLCIAQAEGDISELEKRELDELTARYPSKKTILETYQKLKIKPNFSEVFKHKEKLTRTRILNITHYNLRNIASVAAAVGLLLGIFTLIRTIDIDDVVHIAQEQPTIKEAIKENEVNEPMAEEHKTSTDFIQNNQRIEPAVKEDITPQKDIHIEDLQIPSEVKDRLEVASIEPIMLAKLEFEPNISSKLSVVSQSSFERVSVEQTSNQFGEGDGQSKIITPFDMLQRGVSWVAEQTGANVKLDADKEPDGTITKIYFETTLFAVSRPVRRN